MRRDKVNKGVSLDKTFRKAILAPISCLIFAAWLEPLDRGTNNEKGVAGQDSPPLRQFQVTSTILSLLTGTSRDLTGRTAKGPRIGTTVGMPGRY